uniref:Uncharacterized protein n=1 Tax=Timema tahoe TaxID=61484 RepID=A0A7R9FIH5_9NEOP|nr:unnamed protein product [Timema tahoe]
MGNLLPQSVDHGKCTKICVEGEWKRIYENCPQCTRPGLSTDIPVFYSLIQHESRAIDHAGTEAGDRESKEVDSLGCRVSPIIFSVCTHNKDPYISRGSFTTRQTDRQTACHDSFHQSYTLSLNTTQHWLGLDPEQRLGVLENVFLAGDWNVTLLPDDRINCIETRLALSQTLQRQVSLNKLFDVWKNAHPDERGFTYTGVHKNGPRSRETRKRYEIKAELTPKQSGHLLYTVLARIEIETRFGSFIAVLDSSASTSLIKTFILDPQTKNQVHPRPRKIRLAKMGTELYVKGRCRISFNIGSFNDATYILVAKDLSEDLLLGHDWLRTNLLGVKGSPPKHQFNTAEFKHGFGPELNPRLMYFLKKQNKAFDTHKLRNVTNCTSHAIRLRENSPLPLYTTSWRGLTAKQARGFSPSQNVEETNSLRMNLEPQLLVMRILSLNLVKTHLCSLQKPKVCVLLMIVSLYRAHRLRTQLFLTGLPFGQKKCGNVKKKVFLWLDCSNGKLSCNVCKEVAQLGAFKKERMCILKEWRSYLVTFNGSNKTAQPTSLRKKILEYKNYFGHTTAESIAAKAKKESIDKVFGEINAS